MNHQQLLTALLNNKAVQREHKKPDEDGETYRELIQFNENDQLVNYDFHLEDQTWYKNDGEYFSLLDFLIDDLDMHQFEIVDKIDMENKLSMRDIIQTLLNPETAVNIRHSFDDYESQSLIQLVDGNIEAYEPVDDQNPNGNWEHHEGIPIDELLDGLDRKHLSVMPSLVF